MILKPELYLLQNQIPLELARARAEMWSWILNFGFVAKPKSNGLNQTHETVVAEGESALEAVIK